MIVVGSLDQGASYNPEAFIHAHCQAAAKLLVSWLTKKMIVVASPDQGASYDPEAFIHAHCQAAANLVIKMGTDYEFWPSAVMAGSSSHYQPDFEKIRK